MPLGRSAEPSCLLQKMAYEFEPLGVWGVELSGQTIGMVLGPVTIGAETNSFVLEVAKQCAHIVQYLLAGGVYVGGRFCRQHYRGCFQGHCLGLDPGGYELEKHYVDPRPLLESKGLI